MAGLLSRLFVRGRPATSSPAAIGEPRLPSGLRIYAVGDIHGRADLLGELESRIRDDWAARPAEQAMIIYLGDFIDRGPRSKEVLDYLSKASGDATARRFLTGNHEATLLRFIDEPHIIHSWRQFGALETLYSYGVDVRDLMRGGGAQEAHTAFLQAFPPEHLAFLRKLETLVVIGGYCFVHAGLKPGIAINKQVPADLLWIRDEFLDFRGAFGKVVVHGHTPVDHPVLLPNRINVDTGAYVTGRLTAVVLEGNAATFLSTGGEAALRGVR
jgi:serine/threonine protein phosphatase 1